MAHVTLPTHAASFLLAILLFGSTSTARRKFESARSSSPIGNSNFLAKLDGNGDVLWTKTTIPGDPRYVRLDPAGNIVISGHYQFLGNFGVASISSAGGLDAYVWRLDSAGNPLSVKTIGTWSTEVAPRISVDGAGKIVLDGNLSVPYDFGQGLKGPGNYNAKLIP